MWKDSIRNIVVIFQTTILRIVGFFVNPSPFSHSAIGSLVDCGTKVHLQTKNYFVLFYFILFYKEIQLTQMILLFQLSLIINAQSSEVL